MGNAALRKTELDHVAPAVPSRPSPRLPNIDLGRNINALKMGLTPRYTGLNFIVWLHRAAPGSNLFVEATPDSDYDHKDRVIAFLEPEFIECSGKMSLGESERLRDFAWDNADLIEDYWFSKVSAVDALPRIRAVPAPSVRR